MYNLWLYIFFKKIIIEMKLRIKVLLYVCKRYVCIQFYIKYVLVDVFLDVRFFFIRDIYKWNKYNFRCKGLSRYCIIFFFLMKKILEINKRTYYFEMRNNFIFQYKCMYLMYYLLTFVLKIFFKLCVGVCNFLRSIVDCMNYLVLL